MPATEGAAAHHGARQYEGMTLTDRVCAPSSAAKPSSPATGMRSACEPSSARTSHCGHATLPRWRSSEQHTARARATSRSTNGSHVRGVRWNGSPRLRT